MCKERSKTQNIVYHEALPDSLQLNHYNKCCEPKLTLLDVKLLLTCLHLHQHLAFVLCSTGEEQVL